MKIIFLIVCALTLCGCSSGIRNLEYKVPGSHHPGESPTLEFDKYTGKLISGPCGIGSEIQHYRIVLLTDGSELSEHAFHMTAGENDEKVGIESGLIRLKMSEETCDIQLKLISIDQAIKINKTFRLERDRIGNVYCERYFVYHE